MFDEKQLEEPLKDVDVYVCIVLFYSNIVR